MKFNKTMAKTLAFSMALGTLSFLSSAKTEVFAAAPAGTFDGTTGVIKVTSGTHWGVAKKLKSAPKKHPERFLKMGEKEWYQIKTVDSIVGGEIDLGKYKGKNVIVAVGAKESFADKADWKIFNIKASNKAFKVYYSSEEGKAGKITTAAANTLGKDHGYLSFFEDKDKQIAAAVVGTNVEVKVGDGNWQTAKDYFKTADDDGVENKLKVLTQRGAKLTFRLKADDSWPSKEVKFTIPSQKKGPSVKLDVDKEVSNLKKGLEFGIAYDDAVPASFKTSPAGKEDFAKLGIKNTEASDQELKKIQVLYVREPKGKKMASKFTKIFITRQAKPTLASALTANGIVAIKAQGANLIDDKLTFNLNVAYDVKKGATITNKNIDKDFEIYVDYDGTEKATLGKKWIKVKRAKDDTKPTIVKLSYSDTKKKNAFKPGTSKLYLRTPGTKQVGNEVTIASDLAEAGISVSNIEQAMSITSPTNGSNFGISNATDEEFTLKFVKEKETEYTIKAKITNVTKKSGKPKFKITTAPPSGVKVSVDEMAESSDDATFEIKISISNKAFTTDPSGQMKFKIEHESLSKEYTVKFATP